MQKYSRYLGIALGLGFFMVALIAFIKGQPESRDKRVYAQLKPYIPYKIEKKMSGLRIVDTRTGEKIEPTNMDFYQVLDNLEKDWGARHLKLDNNTLIVIDDNNQTVGTITLPDQQAKTWVRRFFGI